MGVKLTIASRIRFSRSEFNIQGHAGMDASVAFTYMDVRLKAALVRLRYPYPNILKIITTKRVIKRPYQPNRRIRKPAHTIDVRQGKLLLSPSAIKVHYVKYKFLAEGIEKLTFKLVLSSWMCKA